MKTLAVKKASSFAEKTKGLIGVKKPYPLLLETRFGIHTFGVVVPLDIVILDTSYKITRLKKLVPNRIYLWPPIWNIVLELPTGSIEKFKLHIGDQVMVRAIN